MPHILQHQSPEAPEQTGNNKQQTTQMLFENFLDTVYEHTKVGLNLAVKEQQNSQSWKQKKNGLIKIFWAILSNSNQSLNNRDPSLYCEILKQHKQNNIFKIKWPYLRNQSIQTSVWTTGANCKKTCPWRTWQTKMDKYGKLIFKRYLTNQKQTNNCRY